MQFNNEKDELDYELTNGTNLDSWGRYCKYYHYYLENVIDILCVITSIYIGYERSGLIIAVTERQKPPEKYNLRNIGVDRICIVRSIEFESNNYLDVLGYRLPIIQLEGLETIYNKVHMNPHSIPGDNIDLSNPLFGESIRHPPAIFHNNNPQILEGVYRLWDKEISDLIGNDYQLSVSGFNWGKESLMSYLKTTRTLSNEKRLWFSDKANNLKSRFNGEINDEDTPEMGDVAALLILSNIMKPYMRSSQLYKLHPRQIIPPEIDRNQLIDFNDRQKSDVSHIDDNSQDYTNDIE